MERALLYSGLSWLVPGLGYWLLGKWGQGILVFILVVSLVLIGVFSGGLYYPGSAADFGLMYWLQAISSAGNGIFLFFEFLFKSSTLEIISKAFGSPYFEYGGRSLAFAGLLNYLSILDVFDQCTNRKQ